MKIFIVEDQRIVLQGIRRMFSHFSSDEFFCFDDPKKAREMLLSVKPDAIFTDIVMRDFSGLDLIETASKLLPDCRYVIFSGYADFEFARKAISLHVDEYLVKPVSREALEGAWKKISAPSAPAQQGANANQKISEKAQEYISKHAENALTINDIATAIHIAPNYLSNVFRRETGITITESIRSEQMCVAKRLLKDTNMYLYEIATQLGYRDIKYFSLLFKEYFGMTPKAYRDSLNMENNKDEQDNDIE